MGCNRGQERWARPGLSKRLAFLEKTGKNTHAHTHTQTHAAPSTTARPLARDPRVLIAWPLPLGFGLDGRLLLERRGRACV